MRYAIISDIHSNLEALETVLSRVDALDVDELVCLGDIVGYNANPNECVEIIRKRNVRAVLGNHDTRAVGMEEPGDFNPVAASAVLWARQALTEENKRFLDALPRTLNVKDDKGREGGAGGDVKFTAVHGWVNDTDSYIFGPEDAAENFRLLKTITGSDTGALCFFGHTHVRITYVEEGGRVSSNLDDPLTVKPDANYLVNPGSVGQPRDGDPRAAFAVLDGETAEITFYRVEYDIEKCAGKILEAGLPDVLATRLKAGW